MSRSGVSRGRPRQPNGTDARQHARRRSRREPELQELRKTHVWGMNTEESEYCVSCRKLLELAPTRCRERVTENIDLIGVWNTLSPRRGQFLRGIDVAASLPPAVLVPPVDVALTTRSEGSLLETSNACVPVAVPAPIAAGILKSALQIDNTEAALGVEQNMLAEEAGRFLLDLASAVHAIDSSDAPLKLPSFARAGAVGALSNTWEQAVAENGSSLASTSGVFRAVLEAIGQAAGRGEAGIERALSSVQTALDALLVPFPEPAAVLAAGPVRERSPSIGGVVLNEEWAPASAVQLTLTDDPVVQGDRVRVAGWTDRLELAGQRVDLLCATDTTEIALGSSVFALREGGEKVWVSFDVPLGELGISIPDGVLPHGTLRIVVEPGGDAPNGETGA